MRDQPHFFLAASLVLFVAAAQAENKTPISQREVPQIARRAQVQLNRDLQRTYRPNLLAREFHECATLKLLRTTAVMLSDDDGGRAMAQKKHNRIVPVEPWLRNSAIHTKAGENYVYDWIATANLQLLMSGACFAFDIANLKYVLEKNTVENSRDCGDESAAAIQTQQWVQDHIDDPAPGNKWHDAVILLFRWGKGAQPAGQACSGALSNHVLMAGNYVYQHAIDVTIKLGSSQLTHEFGHFMSLDHSMEGTMQGLADTAFGENSAGLPLATANLPQMPNLTQADIDARRQNFIDKLKTFPGAWDADTAGNAGVGVPDTYGISDTPPDMGMGLPLLMGDFACQGELSYTFTRYHPDDLMEVRDGQNRLIWWTPVVFRAPRTYEETIVVDDTVRNNVMNYSICAPMLQRFSKDQVTRMTWYLWTKRAYAIGRTIHSRASKWVKKPLLVREYFPSPKPWPPGELQSEMKKLRRRGSLVIPDAGESLCTSPAPSGQS